METVRCDVCSEELRRDEKGKLRHANGQGVTWWHTEGESVETVTEMIAGALGIEASVLENAGAAGCESFLGPEHDRPRA